MAKKNNKDIFDNIESKIVEERFARQMDFLQQEKIRNSRLLVVGSDYASDLMMLSLVSLGAVNVDYLTTLNSEKDSFLDSLTFRKGINNKEKYNNERSYYEKNNKNNSFNRKKEGLERLLKTVYHNTEARVLNKETFFAEKNKENYNKKNKKNKKCYDIIFDFSFNQFDFNDSFLKKEGYYLDYDNKPKKSIINKGLNVGLALGDFFKFIKNEKITYSKTNLFNSVDKKILKAVNNKNIILIGAGAIGNFAALALSYFKKDFTIIDFDIVESHNLNRQVLLYDGLKKNKAEVLKNKLKKINNYNGDIKKEKINEKNIELLNHEDIILGAVDNAYARLLINDFVIKSFSDKKERNNYKIYIDGGTSLVSGSAYYFSKGDYCIGCKKDLKPEKKSHSCALKKEAVIVPNLIVGHLMIGLIGDSEIKDYNYDFYYNAIKKNKPLIFNRKCYCKDFIY